MLSIRAHHTERSVRTFSIVVSYEIPLSISPLSVTSTQSTVHSAVDLPHGQRRSGRHIQEASGKSERSLGLPTPVNKERRDVRDQLAQSLISLSLNNCDGGGHTCQLFRMTQRTSPSATSVHRTSVELSTEFCTASNSEHETNGERRASGLTDD